MLQPIFEILLVAQQAQLLVAVLHRQGPTTVKKIVGRRDRAPSHSQNQPHWQQVADLLEKGREKGLLSHRQEAGYADHRMEQLHARAARH
mmetsp:Transcript_8208/g.13192  ORF Transcript_8208/g.13192 Transcript_8208/m.13192 type:complete len:90 (+) Transcript_8208:342-611(+)